VLVALGLLAVLGDALRELVLARSRVFDYEGG